MSVKTTFRGGSSCGCSHGDCGCPTGQASGQAPADGDALYAPKGRNVVPPWHRLSGDAPTEQSYYNRRLETEGLFPEKSDDKDY